MKIKKPYTINKWSEVRDFFRKIPTGDFTVRAAYMDSMKDLVQPSLLDLYRCYLQRAGYIYDQEYYFRNRGVYFMSKPIPANLTLTQAIKEAYPDVGDRKEAKKTAAGWKKYKMAQVRARLGL